MTALVDKQPMYVHCADCSHEWVCAYLPMPVEKVVKLMKAPCPMCGGKKVYEGQIQKPTGDGDAEAWIGNGDTGTSSLTIWAVLMKRKSPHGHFDAPHDPADFGRCYRLLKVMPSWRQRLPEVAAKCKAFAPLVEKWDELTSLYEEEITNADGRAPKLYKRIQELRGAR